MFGKVFLHTLILQTFYVGWLGPNLSCWIFYVDYAFANIFRCPHLFPSNFPSLVYICLCWWYSRLMPLLHLKSDLNELCIVRKKQYSLFDQSNMSVIRGLMPTTDLLGKGWESQLKLNICNIPWYSENISPATYKRARPPRLGLCPQLSSGGWGDGASASVESVDTAHCGFRGVAGTQLQASPLPCPPDFTFIVVGIS